MPGRTPCSVRAYLRGAAAALAALSILLAVEEGAAQTHGATASSNAAEDFRRQMEVAAEEYARGNWQAAHVAYLRAWRLKPHFAIAGNLADVEVRLGRFRDAATHLDFFLANLPKDYADRRADAEQLLEQCSARLVAITIIVNVPGATILVDGAGAGHAPLRSRIWLVPGPHSVEARSPGYLGARLEFTAQAGEIRQAELILQSPQLAELREPPNVRSGFAHSPPESSSGVPARTWVLMTGGALTAASLAVGVGYAIAAQNAKERLRVQLSLAEAKGSPELAAKHGECTAAPPERPSECASLPGLLDDWNSAIRMRDSSFILSAALGSLTVATYLLWPREKRAPLRNTAAPALSIKNLSATAGPSCVGVQWSGRF